MQPIVIIDPEIPSRFSAAAQRSNFKEPFADPTCKHRQIFIVRLNFGVISRNFFFNNSLGRGILNLKKGHFVKDADFITVH